MWKLNKSIAKELLPTQPVDFLIEPWWGICLVNFTLEEFKVSNLVLLSIYLFHPNSPVFLGCHIIRCLNLGVGGCD